MYRGFKSCLLSFAFAIPAVHAQTFLIDPNQSLVHTTNWSNWDWDLMGAPDDAVDSFVSGHFDLVIEPGGYHEFTGNPAPERISFIHVEVSSPNISGREWAFPDFKGFYFGTTFEGSEDPCFGFGYYTSGTCLSAGNMGTYSGTFDGQTLRIQGTKNADLIPGSNSFAYTIVATAVPEPNNTFYFASGVVALSILAARRRRLAHD